MVQIVGTLNARSYGADLHFYYIETGKGSLYAFLLIDASVAAQEAFRASRFDEVHGTWTGFVYGPNKLTAIGVSDFCPEEKATDYTPTPSRL